MNTNLNLFLILFFNQYIHSITGECPPDLLIKPCSCISATPSYPSVPETTIIRQESIVCEHIYDPLFNLQDVFLKISLFNVNENSTYFHSFRLSNTTIKDLPENVFIDIKFQNLIFQDNFQLTTIDKNAFSNTKNDVEVFETLNTNLSDSETIFFIIRQFQNLRFLSMHNDQLNSIPNYAFNHKYLSYINFGLEFSNRSQPIETIGDYAFYNLPKLHFLRIISPKLSKINKYSFALRDRSELKNDLSNILELYLGGEMLNSTSFPLTSLNRFRNRFVFIRFFGTSITYLDENIFQPFLESNPSSLIDLGETNLLYKCHCRSAWIQNDYMKSVDQMDVRVYGGAGCWGHDFTNCTLNQ
jgi:hypothetical protein